MSREMNFTPEKIENLIIQWVTPVYYERILSQKLGWKILMEELALKNLGKNTVDAFGVIEWRNDLPGYIIRLNPMSFAFMAKKDEEVEDLIKNGLPPVSVWSVLRKKIQVYAALGMEFTKRELPWVDDAPNAYELEEQQNTLLWSRMDREWVNYQEKVITERYGYFIDRGSLETSWLQLMGETMVKYQ